MTATCSFLGSLRWISPQNGDPAYGVTTLRAAADSGGAETYTGAVIQITHATNPAGNQTVTPTMTTVGNVSTFTYNWLATPPGQYTVTITVNGGTLGPGVYQLTLRATGTNSAGQPVTRMLPFNIAIATASTSNEYVDILGFTTFRITSMDSNAVYGYAISGVYSDMNDPALRRGQVARLVPWN